MRKWAGDQVYELMWEPLMIGKFGEKYAKQVNMAWMWARLKARTTRLGTFQGGFQAFADQFAARLLEMGVQIHFSSKITQIVPTADGKVAMSNGQAVSTFDQVTCHHISSAAWRTWLQTCQKAYLQAY